jgi:hypothetical protein
VEGELDVHLPGTLSDGETSDIAAGEPSLEDELGNLGHKETLGRGAEEVVKQALDAASRETG